jgi:hypothetical protein
MAITNAQQYKQLVNPPMEGKKRPGYRGDAAARSTGAAQSGRADPGPRGDPGEGRASKGSGVSEATGGFAPTKGVGAGVGPTGRDDLVRQSLLNQAKEFRTQQQEKRKGLNLLEKFRVNRLKKLYERKKLPQFKYAPIGIELIQSLSPTQLWTYKSTSADDLMDIDYGMTGEDLTDADRLADAINKAESTGVISQSDFEEAFFGPGGKPTVDDRDGPQDPCRGPNPPAYCFTGIRSAAPVVEEEPEYVNPLSKLTPRIAGTQFAAAGGGIASLEDMDRKGFVLGGIAKGLKKAVRGIKKLAKSPIGKAALGFAAFQYGGGLGGIMDKFNKLTTLQKVGLGIGATSLAAGAMTPKEDKFDIDSYYAANQLNPSQSIRGMGSEFDFYGGERMRVAEGGSTEEKEPVAKKTMPLLDMDGMEKDYRADGGFVPIGRMEKADDVPARLSKNEFVFTADAVRNAGDGDVDKGAEVMYNMMKNLESGGEVSEESQGLEGARKMFQTSQRLEEVL